MRSTAFCMAACMQELCDVSLADAVEASVFHEATSRQPKLVSCMQGLQWPMLLHQLTCLYCSLLEPH